MAKQRTHTLPATHPAKQGDQVLLSLWWCARALWGPILHEQQLVGLWGADVAQQQDPHPLVGVHHLLCKAEPHVLEVKYWEGRVEAQQQDPHALVGVHHLPCTQQHHNVNDAAMFVKEFLWHSNRNEAAHTASDAAEHTQQGKSTGTPPQV